MEKDDLIETKLADNIQACLARCDKSLTCQLAAFKQTAPSGSGACSLYNRMATISDYVKCDTGICLSNALDAYNFNVDGTCDNGEQVDVDYTIDHTKDDGDDDDFSGFGDDDQCGFPTFDASTTCTDSDVAYLGGNFFYMQCSKKVDPQGQSFEVYNTETAVDCLIQYGGGSKAVGYAEGQCLAFTSAPVYSTTDSFQTFNNLFMLEKMDVQDVNGQDCPMLTF